MRRFSGLALLVASVAAIAARRPDVFTVPQFWAEDGMEWYARAYNEPGVALLIAPYGGYLQLFPRIAGWLSQLVPFSAAPLLIAVLALSVQAVAPVYLLTDRFAWAVPSRVLRCGLAILLIAVPNLMEVHANVSNSQVHLAFLAFLVLLSEPAETRAWKAFDAFVLLLSGFSGPFCLLLWPVAVVAWWHRRDGWSLVRVGCVTLPAFVQAALLSPRATPPSVPTSRGLAIRAPLSPYGATPGNLLRIFGGQIVVGGLGGWHAYVGLHDGLFAAHPWLPALIGLAGIAFLARAAWVTESLALRLLLLYATLHMSAGLASPIIIGDRPVWEMLAVPGAGQRYWYTMTLAFLATIVWTVIADPRRSARVAAGFALALLLLVGIRGDWALPPHEDLDFATQARRLAQSPAGRIVRIPIPPSPMDMTLIRGCEEPRVPVVRRNALPVPSFVAGEAGADVNPERSRRLRSRRACPDR